MKVIVVEDVSADEFKAVLAELKGSQLVLPLAPKPLAVPASATQTWIPKRVFAPSTKNSHPYGYSAKEVQLLRGFHKDPQNHYSNGRYLPGVLESLASSLGKKRNAVLGKIKSLNMHKVRGLVHQTHKPTRFKKTPLEAPIEATGALRGKNQSWTPRVTAEFRKDYPVMMKSALVRKYGNNFNALRVKAWKLGIKRMETVRVPGPGEMTRVEAGRLGGVASAKKRMVPSVNPDVVRRKGEAWTPELTLAFKRDYPLLSRNDLGRKYSLTGDNVYVMGRRFGATKRGNVKMVESGAIRKRYQPWTPSLQEEFKKDYPRMGHPELMRKYNLTKNGLYITAFDLHVKRREGLKPTDKLAGESNHAYMLRKKASVPWPTPPGKAAPAGPPVVTEELVQLEFPRLKGIDCQQHYVQRSFTSLAKHEFKELTYSGIGNFVLGIKSLQDWESFLTSAMTNFSLIAKVCGVPNRYRIASAGEDRVVRYG